MPLLLAAATNPRPSPSFSPPTPSFFPIHSAQPIRSWLTAMGTVQMAHRTETSQTSSLAIDRLEDSNGARIVPVPISVSVPPPTISMSPPSPVDHPMEGTSPEDNSPPGQAPDADPGANGKSTPGRPGNASPHDQSAVAITNNMPAPPPAAAAAVHQPKIVQTAFIHKLYK